MNIILLEADDWTDDQRVHLRGRRFQHLQQVLKVAVGDSVRVGQLGGQRGTATVETIDNDGITLLVELKQAPAPCHPCTVVLALPRPKMLRRVLRTCAEFGVTDIHLIHSYRVEKSFWQSPLLAPAPLREALLAGLERSGGTQLPNIVSHRRFRPFVEDELPLLAQGRVVRVAHPGDYPRMPADSGESAVLVLGPEGGFIPFETELLAAQGASLYSLGSRILSVDTALTTVLGRELT